MRICVLKEDKCAGYKKTDKPMDRGSSRRRNESIAKNGTSPEYARK
jgi:hypothetical protein